MPSDARQTLGILGEDLAVAELRRRGYAILARRHRSKHGEIDIIAEDGRCVVFVEVKLRSSDLFGEAVEAVPSWKRRRLISLARAYLASQDLMDRPARFDIATVDGTGAQARVEILEYAFGEDD